MTKEVTLQTTRGGAAAVARTAAAPRADELTDARIRYGMRLVLSREPSEHELAVLLGLYQKAHAEAPTDRDVTILASIASAIFNLDAALMR